MFRVTQIEIDQIKNKISNGNCRIENGKALIEISLSDLNSLFDLTYRHERNLHGTHEVLSKANEILQQQDQELKKLQDEISNLTEQLNLSNVRQMELITEKSTERNQKLEYIKTIHLLNSENKKFRETLSYYADENNYIPKDDLCQHEIDLDSGYKAKKALEVKTNE